MSWLIERSSKMFTCQCIFFSDGNDFVSSLPGIPSSKGNHSRFRNIFNKKKRIINAVYKAAYRGDKSYYLPKYPKNAVDPTIVLQFMMLNSDYDKEEENDKGNTPLHLASARGNVEAVRILMESKATSKKDPTNNEYFILLEKLEYDHNNFRCLLFLIQKQLKVTKSDGWTCRLTQS